MSTEDRLIHIVRCPLCGELPDLVLTPLQAFCGNDGCDAVQFSPGIDPAEQLAGRTALPFPLPDSPDGAQVRRPRQVPGSVEDLAREAEIRGFLHGYGYRCLPGQCPVCDTGP